MYAGPMRCTAKTAMVYFGQQPIASKTQAIAEMIIRFPKEQLHALVEIATQQTRNYFY